MEPVETLYLPSAPAIESAVERIASHPRVIWPSPTDVTPASRLYISTSVAASALLYASTYARTACCTSVRTVVAAGCCAARQSDPPMTNMAVETEIIVRDMAYLQRDKRLIDPNY